MRASAVIRPARAADAPVITRFNLALARETESLSLAPVSVQRGVRALLRTPAKGAYFLAELDGAIAGQLLLTYEWSDWRNGNFWWIQSVYVAPGFRRRGVFRALYAHVERLARSRRDVCGLRLYVERGNRHAKRTYRRLGMAKTHYELFEVDFVLGPGTGKQAEGLKS